MKKVIYNSICLLLILGLAGCASFKSLLHPSAKADKNAAGVVLPPYSGPKAGILVTDFDLKATKATVETGVGLYEIFIATLSSSNRFLLLPRQELGIVTQPQEAGATAAIAKEKARTADLIITVAVTEFEPQASGGKAGVGGGGSAACGLLGGLLGVSLNKAHMALDIRIVNASTSEVLVAGRIQGQAAEVSGTSSHGLLDNTSLAGALSIYNNTPMAKAIRTCIIEAVSYISKNIPPEYYKY